MQTVEGRSRSLTAVIKASAESIRKIIFVHVLGLSSGELSSAGPGSPIPYIGSRPQADEIAYW